MRIIKLSSKSAANVIAGMKRKLSVGGGAVTPGMRRKTMEVFGKQPLAPIEVVRKIVSDVRRDGDKAVFRYVKLLDGCKLTSRTVRVSATEIAVSVKKVSPKFLRAAKSAIARVRKFQKHILERGAGDMRDSGRRLGVRYVQVRRVGVLVPGFSAVLPSSAIMTVVPAQVAGVEEIAVCTPPNASGKACAETLACCALLGVTEVYRIGGAQAVAALAYGTKSIAKADMIVGPGNIFTTLAKKEVFGDVGIDMLAGPSEVLVLADGSARAKFVAADILAQAEHAPAAAFLVTPSERLALAVAREVSKQLAKLSRRDRTAAVIDEYSLAIVTRNMAEAIETTNSFAPEHLQVQTNDNAAALRKIRNAGTVFVGEWTPVACGDYYAGPSHTLPTGGTAAFFSGLSANSFVRRMSVVQYDKASLERDAANITTLAEAEGLTAHAESVRARLRK